MHSAAGNDDAISKARPWAAHALAAIKLCSTWTELAHTSCQTCTAEGSSESRLHDLIATGSCWGGYESIFEACAQHTAGRQVWSNLWAGAVCQSLSGLQTCLSWATVAEPLMRRWRRVGMTWAVVRRPWATTSHLAGGGWICSTLIAYKALRMLDGLKLWLLTVCK